MSNVSEARIADDLRHLTELLEADGQELSGGLLGGHYGYGTNYENDVFEMHPFWWGDCECGFETLEAAWEDTHDHEDSCYQAVIRQRGFLDFDNPKLDELTYEEREKHNHDVIAAVCAEMGLDSHHGSYVHCTCSHDQERKTWRSEHDHDPKCGVVLPNFRHKASGIQVDWYKYIGRSMEFEPVDRDVWTAMMAEVAESISPTYIASSTQ
jgi:hypothetical protein